MQVTQSSWLLFMPLAFLTTAFMPKELLSGWFKVAVTLNPVDYVMEGVRTIIIEGWHWDSILPGLWVPCGVVVAISYQLSAIRYQVSGIGNRVSGIGNRVCKFDVNLE